MDWFRLAGIRKFVLTLLCVGLALSAANVVHAQPKPNAQVQKILEDKEISYVDWLLFDGIYTGNVEQVSRALRSGANPNTARNFQADHPPLFAALVATSNAAIVSLLIQKGADVNARYIATPSTNMSQLSAAERLILAVRANEQRRYYSPLYYAVAFGNNIKVVEMLLEAGATADSRGGGRTALFATYDIDIAKALLRRGADINATDLDGLTVLGNAKLFYIGNSPSHYTRPRVDAFCEWLITQGAHE